MFTEFYFYDACYNYIWKLKCSPIVRILYNRILNVLKCSVVKDHLKQVEQIVLLIFCMEILVSFLQRNTDRDVSFACKEE